MTIGTVSRRPLSDPQDPHKDLYDVDNPSTIITLNDWYQQYTEELAGEKYFTPLSMAISAQASIIFSQRTGLLILLQNQSPILTC